MKFHLVSLACLAIASTAFAAPPHFTPAKTAFTMTGTMTFYNTAGSQIQCPYTISGMTGLATSQTATVTSANFCSRVVPVGLPWTFKVVNHESGGGWAIAPLTFLIDGNTCGAGFAQMNIKKGADTWGSGNLQPCFLQYGTGTSTPTLAIAK